MILFVRFGNDFGKISNGHYLFNDFGRLTNDEILRKICNHKYYAEYADYLERGILFLGVFDTNSMLILSFWHNVLLARYSKNIRIHQVLYQHFSYEIKEALRNNPSFEISRPALIK